MKDRWWQRPPRRPGLVLAVAMLAALAASAGITAIVTAGGGSHRPLAAGAGRVSVAPAAGSLALNGFVEVTVTVTSKTALTTQIVVEPGNLSVTVVYKPKPAPAPSPAPSPSHRKDGNGDG